MFVKPFLSTEVGRLMSYGARIASSFNSTVRPFRVYVDNASTLKFKEVRRPSTGVFDFRYERPTRGTFVFVTSTGVAGPNMHNNAVPIIRTITDEGFVSFGLYACRPNDISPLCNVRVRLKTQISNVGAET